MFTLKSRPALLRVRWIEFTHRCRF